jgi:TRAP-type uncharacterized transport system substrate-binding protein
MLRKLLFPATTRRGRAYLLVLIAVACIAWAAYLAVEAYHADAPIAIRLAAGSNVERRYQIAEYLAAEAADENLQIELVQTSGFSDAIARLESGEVDAAIVSSGIKVHDSERVRVAAGLDVAPLHIFVRSDLAASGRSLTKILTGARIEHGMLGTNDYALACEVLKYLRITGIGGRAAYTEVDLSKAELIRLADEVNSLVGEPRMQRIAELPDAVMLVGSLPSNVAQHLLDTDVYTLVPFPHGRPFMMTDAGGAADGLNRLYVEQCTITAGMYLGDTPVPATDAPTMGMRNILVTRADLSDEAIRRLMATVFETSFAERIHPTLPDELAATFEMHDGATAYLQSQQPLLTGQFFNDISQFFSIFGAFSAGALSIYGYLRRRRIRRPDEYLTEIRSIDALASDRDTENKDRKLPVALARELDNRLIKLKEQLIKDYCENRVQGELVLMSILSMLSDSRSHVRRAAGNQQFFESEHALPTMTREPRPIPPIAA